MDEGRIVELLQDFNPWRRTGEVDLPDYIIRREVERKFDRLWETGNVVGILGLRRTGKTTFARQKIRDIGQEEGFDRLCYFSFDLEEASVKEVVETFCERILGEPVSELESETYFFFDEVQNLEDWSREVKHFHDSYENIRFVVTGSSAANILKGAGESLAGRFSPIRIYPFSFPEYLRYMDEEVPEVSLGNPVMPENSRKLRVEFENYLEAGGLPELYRSENPEERLEEVLDLVFFRDIVEIFEVGRADLLSGIFRILARNTGQKVNYANISDSLDSDFRTVNSYISYLEDSFLIERSRPHDKSEMSRQRKNPKIYVSDHLYGNLYGSKKGLVAETVAFNHLKRLETPSHLIEPETDIALPERQEIFELKHSNSVENQDLEKLEKNADETGFEPYLVTRDRFGTREYNNNEIRLLPLWLLCLGCTPYKEE